MPERVVEPFVDYLQKLARGRQGRTAMNAFRHASGRQLSEARTTWPFILRWCPRPGRPWRDEVHFLVATTYALHGIAYEYKDEEEPEFNFGDTLRRLAAVDGAWRDTRFQQLLLSDRDTMATRIRGLIASLKKAKVPIDYSLFLRDLIYWRPDGRVAMRWARHYYRSNDSTEENS